MNVRFTRPDLVFVADKFGTNTNMSKEKLSAGNNKYLHTKGCRVSVPACIRDTHFTTMGLTALMGEPVCCVVIIQKTAALTFIERFGFDIDAKWEWDLSVFDQVKEKLSSVRSNNKYKGLRHCFKELGKEDFNFDIPLDLMRKKIGRGKVFPCSPVCEFNGKNIPTFLTNSDFWLKS